MQKTTITTKFPKTVPMTSKSNEELVPLRSEAVGVGLPSIWEVTQPTMVQAEPIWKTILRTEIRIFKWQHRAKEAATDLDLAEYALMVDHINEGNNKEELITEAYEKYRIKRNCIFFLWFQHPHGEAGEMSFYLVYDDDPPIDASKIMETLVDHYQISHTAIPYYVENPFYKASRI